MDEHATRDVHAGEQYLSVSIWESRDRLMAIRDRVPPTGPLGLKPDYVQIYDVDDAR